LKHKRLDHQGKKEAKNEKCYESNSRPRQVGRLGGQGEKEALSGKARGQSSQQLQDIMSESANVNGL